MIAALCLALAVLVWPAGAAGERLREIGGGRVDAAGPLADVRRWGARIPVQAAAPALAGVAALVAAGPLHAGAAVVLTATVVDLRRRGAAHRGRLEALATWERSLDDASSALRAGAGPEPALDRAAVAAASGSPEVAGVLRAASSHARLGGDVAASLRGSVGAVGVASAAPAAHAAPADSASVDPVAVELAGAWQVATRHGVPLASVVDGLRADVASRRARAVRVDAALSGPRATAVILTALPGFGMLLGSGFGANPLAVLISGPLGGALCLAGAVLLAAGLLWTDRIVDGARR